MDEAKVRQIVGEMLSQQAFADAFTTNKTPNHSHNGIDSPSINQVDILPNNKFRTSLIVSGGTTVDTLSTGILNPTSIQLYGIASDGIGGRFSLAGRAEFGPGFETDGVSVFPIGTVPGPSLVVAEVCSYVFNRGSTTRVGAAGFLALGNDDSITQILKITITAWTSTSVTFESTVADGWTVTTFLLIS